MPLNLLIPPKISVPPFTVFSFSKYSLQIKHLIFRAGSERHASEVEKPVKNYDTSLSLCQQPRPFLGTLNDAVGTRSNDSHFEDAVSHVRHIHNLRWKQFGAGDVIAHLSYLPVFVLGRTNTGSSGTYIQTVGGDAAALLTNNFKQWQWRTNSAWRELSHSAA